MGNRMGQELHGSRGLGGYFAFPRPAEASSDLSDEVPEAPHHPFRTATESMSTLKGHALIGQSGGPTAVINQSLVGLVERCVEHRDITGVYGALNGIRGIIEELSLIHI